MNLPFQIIKIFKDGLMLTVKINLQNAVTAIHPATRHRGEYLIAAAKIIAGRPRTRFPEFAFADGCFEFAALGVYARR
jgi:hypothetical protein